MRDVESSLNRFNQTLPIYFFKLTQCETMWSFFCNEQERRKKGVLVQLAIALRKDVVL